MTPVQRFRLLASILLFLVALKPTLSLSLEPSEENQNKELVASSLKVSGYAQLLFTEQNDNQDTFAVRRARLNLGGNLAKKLKLKLQVDLTRSPALMDAVVDLALDEKINFRLGQFLVPFSLENSTSAAELLTINRSRTVELLAPGRDNRAAGRDIGASFFGSFSFLEYSLGLINGSGINRTDDNHRKDLAGRLVVHPIGNLKIGFSLYRGRKTEAGQPDYSIRNKYGAELCFNQSWFHFQAEFIRARDGQVVKQGWYAQGAFDLKPDRYQLVLKLDTVNLDRNLPDLKTTVFTAGASWYLANRSKLQANFEYRREKNGPDDRALLIQLQVGF